MFFNINSLQLSEHEHESEIEIEASTQNSLDSDLISIDLNIDQFNIKRIKHNRNRQRINNGIYMGSLAFDIIWQDNSETREPLQNLIDKNTESINEFIIDIIEDYKKTAINYPTHNRCCIMCWHKVHDGDFMCNKHRLMYTFLYNNLNE